MSEVTLTKDARKVLKAMYEEYGNRKSSGESRTDAAYFANPSFNGYLDVAQELSAAGYIKTNILGGASLEPSAIILFENMTKKAFLAFVDVASKFIP